MVPFMNDGDPTLRIAFARAHTDFGRLLRFGHVREDSNPNLASPVGIASENDTGRFDLMIGHVVALGRLESVFAEVDVRCLCGQDDRTSVRADADI
jgi:hypothetical protein